VRGQYRLLTQRETDANGIADHARLVGEVKSHRLHRRALAVSRPDGGDSCRDDVIARPVIICGSRNDNLRGARSFIAIQDLWTPVESQSPLVDLTDLDLRCDPHPA